MLPVTGIERIVPKFDLGEHFGVRVAKEGRIAAEHDVHDDADAPEVAELVVLAGQDLGRHVVRGTRLSGEHFTCFKLAGQTEVDDFQKILLNGSLGHEQEILRLEISVANMVLVHVVDGPDNLLHQYGGLDLGEVSGLDNSVEEFSSSSEFHHEVDVSVVLKRLEELDDVRVIHHLHDRDLLLEAVDVLHLCLGDRLDRPNVARSLIFGLANGAVRAFS
mmetsp:Transcript_22174/g.48489  ORF Transcript_22174/g.48489 Transcript_22174/m.48489 type:complete len:219 (+) Transcript_22174:857-1513(+)